MSTASSSSSKHTSSSGTVLFGNLLSGLSTIRSGESSSSSFGIPPSSSDTSPSSKTLTDTPFCSVASPSSSDAFLCNCGKLSPSSFGRFIYSMSPSCFDTYLSSFVTSHKSSVNSSSIHSPQASHVSTSFGAHPSGCMMLCNWPEQKLRTTIATIAQQNHQEQSGMSTRREAGNSLNSTNQDKASSMG